MRSLFCVAATLLAAAGAYAQNAFSIITPSNAVVCQPLLLSWQGGTSPYFLDCRFQTHYNNSVLPGSDPNGQALESLGTFNGTSFTWMVNIAAGTQIGLTLRDSAGQVAQSAAFTINPGSDTSCVGKAVSGSAGTATPPAQTPGSSSSSSSSKSTPAVTTTGGAATGGTTATGTSPTSTASTTKSNAASPANVAKIGTAGIVGVALAVLLA